MKGHRSPPPKITQPQLSKHRFGGQSRWAVDGYFLPHSTTLGLLLELPRDSLKKSLSLMRCEEAAEGALMAPVDPGHEIWASGVTYLRSREARKAEAVVADIYQRVYEAERPELFPKAQGWRVTGHGQPVRIRRDSRWNVPEPELSLVVNRHGEIVGYTAGNDISSRDIEGENPLYLPQAKVYEGSCAIGPGIVLCHPGEMLGLSIELKIRRSGRLLFEGAVEVAKMKRGLEELVEFLFRELTFPQGVLLLTGTGIVPPDDFSLSPGDQIAVRVGSLLLENTVAS